MYAISDESRIDIRNLELPKPNYRLDNTRDVTRLINSIAEAGKVVQEFGEELKKRNIPDNLVIYPERLASLQEQIDRIFPAIAKLESNPELYDQPVAIPNQLQSDVLAAIDELIFIFKYEIRINSEKINRVCLKGDKLRELGILSEEADALINEIYIKCAAKDINADEVFAPVEGDLNWLCSQYEKRYQPLIQRLEDNPRLMRKSGAYIENLSNAKDCVSRFVSILRQLWYEQGFGEFQFVPKLVVLEDSDLATQAIDESSCDSRGEVNQLPLEISDRIVDNTEQQEESVDNTDSGHTLLLEEFPPTEDSTLETTQGMGLSVFTPHLVQQQEVVPMISTDEDEVVLNSRTSDSEEKPPITNGVISDEPPELSVTSNITGEGLPITPFVIVNNIKKIATQHGDTTAYQFKKKTKLSPTTAYYLFDNPQAYPSQDAMTKICMVYGCSPGDILTIQTE